MLGIFDLEMLGAPRPALAPPLAQLKPGGSKEQTHTEANRDHQHDEKDENRGWIHTLDGSTRASPPPKASRPVRTRPSPPPTASHPGFHSDRPSSSAFARGA